MQISPQEDLNAFVSAHRMGTQPPNRAVFQPYGVAPVQAEEARPIPALEAQQEPVAVSATPSPVIPASPAEDTNTISRQPVRPPGFNYLDANGDGILKVELRKTVKKERPLSINVPNTEQSDFRGTLRKGMTLAQAATAAGVPLESAESPANQASPPALPALKPRGVTPSQSSAFLLGHTKEASGGGGYAVPVAASEEHEAQPEAPARSSRSQLNISSPPDSGYSPGSPQKDANKSRENIATNEKTSTEIASTAEQPASEMNTSPTAQADEVAEVQSEAAPAEAEQESPASAEEVKSSQVDLNDTPAEITAPDDFHPAEALKLMTFSRAGIKMEGWLEICDEPAQEWTKRWCALEGERIWYFDNPEVTIVIVWSSIETD